MGGNSMKGIFVGAVALTLIAVGVGGYFYFTQETNSSYWEWPLTVGENDVSFTQTQLSSCYSNNPEDVFRSILPCGDEWSLSVFEENTYKNWKFDEGGNTLLFIQPDTNYRVMVSNDPDEDNQLTLRIANKDAGSWSLDFKVGWNRIVFHQNQLDTFSNDDPVTVLSSIDPYWDFIFDGENLNDNYWYNQPDPSHNGGSLQHVKDNVLYLVHVTQDCTLKIQKP